MYRITLILSFLLLGCAPREYIMTPDYVKRPFHRYEEVEGETLIEFKIPINATFICCGCGLVHQYRFRKRGEFVQIFISRDEKYTRKERAKMGFVIEPMLGEER